jgi:hypothetical protein
MRDALKPIWWALIGVLRSRASLEAEILVLRHLGECAPTKVAETARLQQSRSADICLASLYRVAPQVLMPWRLSSQRPLSAGIVLAFAYSGSGSRDRRVADQESLLKFAD